MTNENETVDRLLAEIRELSGPPEVEVVTRERTMHWGITLSATDFERDESGRIARFVGPDKVHTVVRDGHGRPVRLETESETLAIED